MKKYFLYFNFPLVVCYLIYLHLWEKADLSFWETVVAGIKASVFIVFMPIGIIIMAYAFAVEYIFITSIVVFSLSIFVLTYIHFNGMGSSNSVGFTAVKEIALSAIVITLLTIVFLKGSYFILELLGNFSSDEDILYEYRRW